VQQGVIDCGRWPLGGMADAEDLKGLIADDSAVNKRNHVPESVEIDQSTTGRCETGVNVDSVEGALARAVEGATSAGRFDVVAQLCRELEARRLARAGNVVQLESKRGRRS